MSEYEVFITKLDGARRQLETAIVLYFNNGDPASIHTLCMAGYEVIHALKKKRSVPLMERAVGDLMIMDVGDRFLETKKERKLFRDALAKAQNFLKHASSDPNATHVLDPRFTEAMLFDATRNYALIVGECPPTMSIFLFWWWCALHPTELPSTLPIDHSDILKSIAAIAPFDDRQRFYATLLPISTPIRV